MKTYWNNEKTMPYEIDLDFGKSNNPFVNALLAAKNIYYEFYNNGGCNFYEENDFDFCEDDWCDVAEGNVTGYFVDYVEDIRQANLPNYIGGVSFAFTELYEEIYDSLSAEEGGVYYELERFMDRMVELLTDKDLTFDKVTVYQDFDKNLVSMNPHEGFTTITFGQKDEADEWVNIRVNSLGFTLID